MIIAFDADDTLFQFVSTLDRFYNENYGRGKKQFRDYANYNFAETWGVSMQEAIKIVRQFVNSDDFMKMPLERGAFKLIQRLVKRGDSLHVITSRLKDYSERTSSQIENHFPNAFSGIHFSNNHYTGHKSNYGTKAEICKMIKADALIDDSREYALQCEQAGIRCFLVDKPWNQGLEDSRLITRVSGLDDKKLLRALDL